MKKNKKHSETDILEEGAIMTSCDIEEDDFDTIEPQNIFGDIGRHAHTFMLPEEDFAYSKLLNADKEGRATILSKQYCPCPKEGYILVVCEYDINF